LVLQGDAGSGSAWWLSGKNAGYLAIGGNGGVEPASGALNIDTSGNVGLGVTPSAWSTSSGANVETTSGALMSFSTTQFNVLQNSYFNGANYVYKNTAAASGYQQSAGGHIWYSAPSGTAGNAISFTQAMTLDASGNLGVGTASPVTRLDVSGGAVRIRGAAQLQFMNADNTSGASIQNSGTTASDALTFNTTASERVRIDALGNVGIGTSSPGAKLESSVSSSGATAEVLRLSNPGSGGNTQAQINFVTTGTSYGTITSGYGATAPQMTFNLPSATAGNYVWQISGNERLRLDSSGNLISRVNSTAPTLSTNSTMSFELTSNTSLKIVVRGTDGVTRSTTLTLA
jgi:hypothetical protein